MGEDLIAEAKRTQAEVNKLLDFNDIQGIENAEKKTENLTKAFKDYGKAKENIAKIEKEFRDQMKESTDDQIDALVKLDKQLKLQQGKLAEINTLAKLGIKTERDLNKERVETEVAIKKTSKAIREQQTEIVDAEKIAKKEAERRKKLVEKEVKEAKKRKEALDDYSKVLDITRKRQKKMSEATEGTARSLDDLYVELNEQKTALTLLNRVYKAGQISEEKFATLKGKTQLAIKETTQEIRKQEKEILKANELSKKEQKLLESKIVLQKTEIRTLEDVRERMSALRAVVQSLDLVQDADKIKAYNAEINELTDVLSDNSDKFIQSKINVGNYEESIVNALSSTGLFESQLGALNGVLEGVVAWLFKTDDAMDAMDATAQQNVGAIQKLTLAFRRLNGVLKASIIGAILVAVTALASAFGNTRAGAVRTEKAMMTFQSTLANLGQMAQTVFKGIGQSFALIGILLDQISKFSWKDILSGKAVIAGSVQIQQQLKNIKKTFEDIGKVGKSGIDAVVKGLEYIDRAYKIEDKIRRTTQEIAKLNGELQITQSIADDSTKSLATQLLANQKALEIAEKLSEKELENQRDQLEVINNKVKQNILANGVEADNIDLSKTGVEFAKSVLDLAQQRGVSLEIANDLIEEQQAAVVELINVENEHAMVVEDNGKKRREIQRDLFEQNLDLLIDLIDTEKNISEQYVNDVTKNFESRLNEFNRFIVRFRENSQRELDEFTKEVRNMGGDVDFSIQYDENGDFKVFAGDLELATDNIVELNSQLQSIGMNEIDINRFREFMVETRNGVRDFRILGREIKLVGFNVQEMVANLAVSRDELKSLDALQEKIDALNKRSTGDLSDKQRKQLIKDLEALEKEKTAIKEKAELERQQNRMDAIDAELKTVEEGSERYYQLLQERADIEKQIRESAIDGVVDKTKEANKKALEDYKKFSDEVRQVLNAVFDKAVEVQDKRVKLAEDLAERQKELIEQQQERAQQGLANTLAFEQRELGKREAERIKEEKKKERIEKVRALYSSYSNYASRGDDNPIVKALRDFAILEAITASFGDGGVVEDKMAEKNHGIIRGRSHRGRQGGIPILVEGREGIFSAREMENLGKDNFYKMKDLAGLGKVDSNFFTKQRESFVKAVPVSSMDPRVITTLNQVKDAIESKPVPSYDFEQLANGVINIIETIHVKNGKKRTVFPTKKPRL